MSLWLKFIKLKIYHTAGNQTSKLTGSIIWISAKDIASGDILRCETRIGLIHNIKILTNMRSIDVDDINQLEVQAFDKEGNVFSTVEGLKFQWRIEENPQALRIIPIKEAHFKTSEKKAEMERKKLMTDISLLKGLKTGKARVSVQIIEDGYENVPKDSVWLSVIEPFTLYPNYPIYILPNSYFLFGILRMKIIDKKITYKKVYLPTSDFVFMSDKEYAGTIENSGMFHSKDEITIVTVMAQDTAIESNTAENFVHIVPPDQLEIEVFDITEKVSEFGLENYATLIYNADDDNEIKELKDKLVDLHDNTWILVEERYYLANMILFDQGKHKIELTENLMFSLNLDPEFVEIYSTYNIAVTKGQQSNLYIIKALKIVNMSKAIGRLAQVKSSDESVYRFDYERLIVERGIQITSQIKIMHPTPEIRLPYLGYYKASNKGIEKQLWKLPSTGGTGHYKWESQDESIAFAKTSLYNRKIGEIRGFNLGKTSIRVYDALNQFNYAAIDVYVTKIQTLAWLESKIEKEQGGQTDYTSLIAYDDSGKKYTN